MDNIKEIQAQKNREAVKKCMKNKDRINIILPLGTIDRINAYQNVSDEAILSLENRINQFSSAIHQSEECHNRQNAVLIYMPLSYCFLLIM